MFIRRVITVHDIEAAALPHDLGDALGPQDRQAINLGPRYFARLAKRARYPWLADFLGFLGESERWHLEFIGTDDEPLVMYFRFSRGGAPGICLPRWDEPWSALPSVLQGVYGLIGGFHGSMFSVAQDEFCRMDKLFPLSGSVERVGGKYRSLADKAIMFWDDKHGDSLCFIEGKKNQGCWYRHETQELELVGDLEQEVSRLFEATLR
jgi:hypothetical protein